MNLINNLQERTDTLFKQYWTLSREHQQYAQRFLRTQPPESIKEEMDSLSSSMFSVRGTFTELLEEIFTPSAMEFGILLMPVPGEKECLHIYQAGVKTLLFMLRKGELLFSLPTLDEGGRRILANNESIKEKSND